MKNLMIPLAVLLLHGCGGGSSSAEIGDRAYSTGEPTLIGQWEYTHDATGCVERFEFVEDGTYTFAALDERINGTFEQEVSPSNAARIEVTLRVLADNGLSDCEGFSDDDTGDVEVKFIELAQDEFAEFESAVSTTVLKRYSKL